MSRRLIIAITVAAASLTACGGDDASTGSTETAPPAVNEYTPVELRTAATTFAGLSSSAQRAMCADWSDDRGAWRDENWERSGFDLAALDALDHVLVTECTAM
jgi:hypothetical protein